MVVLVHIYLNEKGPASAHVRGYCGIGRLIVSTPGVGAGFRQLPSTAHRCLFTGLYLCNISCWVLKLASSGETNFWKIFVRFMGLAWNWFEASLLISVGRGEGGNTSLCNLGLNNSQDKGFHFGKKTGCIKISTSHTLEKFISWRSTLLYLTNYVNNCKPQTTSVGIYTGSFVVTLQ